MIEISEYDFFVFDCDGVILDSNELKSNAFAASLLNEPTDIVEKFIGYHKKNGGISRYEKFRYYFEKMKNCENASHEVDKALTTFSDIVKVAMTNCNYLPGVMDFIKKLYYSNKKLYVISGSDEKQLIQVFKDRGIYKYFKKIYGSPADKITNIDRLPLELKSIKKGLFFGDSKSDYVASKYFGIDFIFVNGYSEWEVNDDTYNFLLKIKDFKELQD